jgi:hypothetical protein
VPTRLQKTSLQKNIGSAKLPAAQHFYFSHIFSIVPGQAIEVLPTWAATAV